MARLLVLLVATAAVACGGAPNPRPSPVVVPPQAKATRAPRVAVPGALLHAAPRVPPLRGLVAPADWVEEKPALDEIWPRKPAFALDEAWVASSRTVCRNAWWNAPVAEITSKHALVQELRGQMVGDERYLAAKMQRHGARLMLVQERFCMLHDCKPPLSTPSTTLSVCVDDLPPESMAGFTRTLMKLRPTMAPLTGLLELEGIAEGTAQYKRDGDGRAEVAVALYVTPDGNRRARDWLIQRGYAVKTPSIPWQLDSTDPHRSFVVNQATSPVNSFTVMGR